MKNKYFYKSIKRQFILLLNSKMNSENYFQLNLITDKDIMRFFLVFNFLSYLTSLMHITSAHEFLDLDLRITQAFKRLTKKARLGVKFSRNDRHGSFSQIDVLLTFNLEYVPRIELPELDYLGFNQVRPVSGQYMLSF